MRITMLAVGSRGDVQPFVALGIGLRQAGHQVRLATHAEFERFVGEHGLEFAPLGGNPRQILETEAGQAWLASGHNPVAFLRELRRLSEPFLFESLHSTWQACQGAEAVIYSTLAFAGFHVAEKLRIPAFAAALQPNTRTREFPLIFAPPWWPSQPILNLASHLVYEQLSWRLFRSAMDRWRVDQLGLPPMPSCGPYELLLRRRSPFLYGFSPSVVRRPRDWPEHLHVTGYWFLDRPPDWQPPQALVDFLAAGPPPVYVGFGSMADQSAERRAEIALEALRRTGQRGVLMSGWGGLRVADLPDTVLAIAETPHDWLFPRMSAVVHHGGAGTTAAGLRAGVPSVICPFFADQPFWGRRVAALGVGPRPVPQQRLSVERLTAAIGQAVADPTMRDRAATLGARIRDEDGVANAVAVFHHHLPDHSAGQSFSSAERAG